MSSPTTAGGIIPRHYAIALLCGVLSLVDGFDSAAISFAAPVMAADFGTTASRFGGVFTAGMIGSLLAVLTQGALGDRIGRKAVVVGSLLLMGAASLATLWARDLNQLMALRFVAGLGIGAALPNLIALTSEYAPAPRKFIFVTAVFTGTPLGAVLGGIAVAPLLEQGWHGVFVLAGLLPLVLAPAALKWLPESLSFLATPRGDHATTPRPKANRVRLSVGQLFTEGRGVDTALLWTVAFLSLAVSISIVNWLPTVLADAGVTISIAVLGSVALQGGGIFGSLLVSLLIDRVGRWPMIAAYAVGAVGLASLGGLSLSGGAVTAAIFLVGLFFIGGQMCIASLVAFHYPPHLRAQGVGWAIGAGRIGAIAGTAAWGAALARGQPISGVFLAAAAIVALAATALTAIGRVRLQARAQAIPAPAPH